MPHSEETKEIHAALLELLINFDHICRDNDIHYSLHAGTLLGCIREQGFIPWDDDVDVSITRDEYEKLLLVLKNSQNKQFELDTDHNRFPQLWYKTRSNQYVWLDIFIWDGISEKKVLQKIKILILCFFLGFMKNKETMKMSAESQTYKGLIHAAIYLSYLLGKIFPMKIKKQLAEKAERSLQGRKKYIHRSNDLYRGMKLILPTYVMSEYEDRFFEGSRVMVSKYNKEILVSSYGENYMTPIKAADSDIAVHSLARKLHKS